MDIVKKEAYSTHGLTENTSFVRDVLHALMLEKIRTTISGVVRHGKSPKIITRKVMRGSQRRGTQSKQLSRGVRTPREQVLKNPDSLLCQS